MLPLEFHDSILLTKLKKAEEYLSLPAQPQEEIQHIAQNSCQKAPSQLT